MTFRFIALFLWSVSLLMKPAHLYGHPHNLNPLPVGKNPDNSVFIEQTAPSVNQNGNFTVEWNVNIGNQSSLLESFYMKAGFEQAVKDFINLQLQCDTKKGNLNAVFRSLSIRRITTTTGKKQILSGVGKCIGDRDICKKNLQARDSTMRKPRLTQKTSNKKNNPCEDFENNTLFDLFDDVFVDGLFFNYNVDLEGQKQELKDTLELDFNVSFIPTKSESLETVEEVDLSFKRIKDSTVDCSSPQCTIQKEVVVELFRYFADDFDETVHECEHARIMCHDDDLVKYIKIGE